MAGELDTSSSLTIVGWAAGGIAYGAGLIMYVKQKLKAHDEDIAALRQSNNEILRREALNVRQQDITVLRDDINRRLDLILEIVKAKQ